MKNLHGDAGQHGAGAEENRICESRKSWEGIVRTAASILFPCLHGMRILLPRVSPRPDVQGCANAAERMDARESPVEIRF